MNFFDAQDNARRLTRWLVFLYAVATLLIIAGVTAVTAVVLYGYGSSGPPADPGILAVVAVITLLVILGSSLYRTARLSSGGSRVATEMGGVRVTAEESDPLRRRYRNVVEEISIASGVPVPEIYVLENESGINAFAAGYSPDDAAIAVTRGTLNLLDRDELQGVVAHEFSHILNGDMRLNIRLMGVLFGIMVIGLIGRMMLRGGSRGMYIGSRRSKNGSATIVIGLGLAVLGWIGVLFARLIKAAVSRQREYLADASAVQFTRQTRGIADALKKIGGYRDHSYIREADAEEISHMLFAAGARFTSLFATHPPLTERIRALEPSFDDSQYPDVRKPGQPADAEDDGRASAFASAADGAIDVDAQSVVDSIGQPGAAHVAYASALHRTMPEELLAPAHSPQQAWLLVLALLVAPDDALASKQFDLLNQQLGNERCALVRRYHAAANKLGARYTLGLLEIAFPALRRANEQQQQFVLDLGKKLVELDGNVDLREFCLYRVLSRSLANANAPSRAQKSRSPGKDAIRHAAVDLLQLLADRGNPDSTRRQRAFEAGLACFGSWRQNMSKENGVESEVARFRDALDVLQNLRGKTAETLLRAATATVLEDGRVTVTESEMLRTLCASLGCPVPPLVATGEAKS